MPRLGRGAPAVFSSLVVVSAADDPQLILDRFRAAIRSNLQQLPDYTCAVKIERFSRFGPEQPWDRLDQLNLEVAYVAGQELYARAGARRFDSKPLMEMITRGTIGTGQFGLLAAHVFLQSSVKFGFEGEAEENGRLALDYHFDVESGDSAYKLRSADAEAVTGFQGRFRIDPQSLDLIRLEIQAYDIPEKLGLAEVRTIVNYSRQIVAGQEVLLPASATLQAGSSDGNDNLNRLRLTSCRKYGVESALIADSTRVLAPEQGVEPSVSTAVTSKRQYLAAGTLMEVVLDAPLDPQKTSIGEPVQARILRVNGDAGGTVSSKSVLRGRVVRVEREVSQSPVYQLGLEFDTLEDETGAIPFRGTMESAGPAAGLIRASKRLDPTFAKNAKGRIDVLVREVQKGQGILLWEARQGPVPKGLKMTWRVAGEANVQ